MNASTFFENQDDTSFESYLKLVHKSWRKDTLNAMRSLLKEYTRDVKQQQQKQNPKTSRAKTVYRDAELIALIPKKYDGQQSTVYNNYIYDNTIEEFNITQETTAQHQPSASRRSRSRKKVVNMNFVSSEIISDVDAHTDTASSSSSYAPSDQVNKPIGYTCSIEMRELDDFLGPSLPIKNPRFGSLVANALKKCRENQLSPTDCVNRLHASSIFQAAGPFLHFDDDSNGSGTLPDTVYRNIRAFKKAIHSQALYVPPCAHKTLNEMALNNIISSTYLLHGKARLNTRGSELGEVALSISTFLCPLFSAHDQVQVDFDNTSWISKQQDGSDNESLSPDIIFYYRQEGEIVEVGCGEVKKPGVSRALLNEDRMRVLEVMKRQLHLRLCRARKEYEAVSFGVLVQGTSVILMKMRMDLDNGVYMYNEQHAFTLPTTYSTHSHMDISLEIISSFKEQMVESLLKVEDHNCRSIWSQYKPYVRPTVSHFTPIYRN